MNADIGNRVRVIRMADPCPLPSGATGTVRNIAKIFDSLVLDIAWDAPHETRTLNLLDPIDTYEVI